MIRSFRSIAAALAFAALALGTAHTASAAEVRAGISTRETYVGLPVTFQIQISNASKFDPPSIPEVDGLQIKSLGAPSRSTQTTIINGNMSSSSTATYSYEVTPQRIGSFRIPPITVQADGREEQTRAFEFVASKSETGDLMFVEISGKEKQIYVGQSLDLTLKIWLRPYRDKEREITLSEADMWQQISERTNWGAFADRIQQLAGDNQRPAGKEVLRKDRDGVEHSYYLYEIDAKIYPKRPGKIDANDVQIVVEYPTALGQSRDPFASFFDDMPIPGGRSGMFGDESFSSPFGSRLTVQSVRPIVGEAKVEPIDVLEIPTAGRPADYRGAVGKYQVVTEASPSNVKAGDPIKLLIGIAGTGPMELVQAPPLAELPKLTADFKVPNEPLAGFVQGDRKVFSTTIRPRQAGVTQIPAIPFSYFDPEAENFVTVRSAPITVHVSPADTLALDAVVGRNKTTAAGPSELNSTDAAKASPRLAIFTGEDLLMNESPPELIWRPLVLLLALPPLVVLGVLVLRTRRDVFGLASRFGSCFRQCQRRIEEAEQSAEVALALRILLAKRFGLNIARPDAATVVGLLRSAGYRNLAVRCERILLQCEQQGGSGFGGGLSLSELKRDALQMIDDLQTQRRPSRIKPAVSPRNASRLRSSSSTVVAGIALAVALLAAGGDVRAASEPVSLTIRSTEVSLSAPQQQTLLAEANEHYDLALSTAAKDSADAKQALAEAAEKYQLLIDSGVRNNRLYFNLANAYLQSGETGRAVANYRRSIKLDPTNRDSRTNLVYAESLLESRSAAGDTDYASRANDLLNRYVGPQSVLVMAIVAWIGLWAAIGVRLCGIRFPWKTTAVVAIVLFAGTAASYALSCAETSRSMAVVVSPNATLRAGDGANFPAMANVQLGEAQAVEVLKRRGDWVQIRTAVGQSGWLPRQVVESI